MKKLVTLILMMIIIGCTGQAVIEVGINDDALVDAPLGDLVMRVTRIELPEGGTYNAIWEGPKEIQVAIQSSGFVSITDTYLEISPGSYQNLRLTVDSVRYENDTTVMLIDSSFQFVARAFGEIVVEENDELQLVVNIVSSSWFDANLKEITAEAFNQAALRVYWQ